MKRIGSLSIKLLALMVSFNTISLQARVIDPGTVWEQVLMAPDMPRTGGTTPLTAQVWPAAGANFGLNGEGVSADQEGIVYLCDLTTSTTLGSTNNPGGIIWRYDPMTNLVTRFLQPSGNTTGTHIDKKDLIITASADSTFGFREVRRYNTKTGAFTVLAKDYPAGSGNLLVGPNDVTVDHKGRIYFTDQRPSLTNTAPVTWTLPFAVYRIDTDGSLHQIITNLARPNGIEISPDGSKLYVCNSAGPNAAPSTSPPNSFSPLSGQGYDVWGFTLGAAFNAGNSGGNVVVYDLNENGEIVDANGNVSPENSNTTVGRSIISRSNVVPDGCAMDIDGNMYIAWHNSPFNTSGPINGWVGEIAVVDPRGNQIDNLTPELISLPLFGPPTIPTPTLTSENQILNFRTVQLGFGKGKTKNILYLIRGNPFGFYRIKTNKIGFS